MLLRKMRRNLKLDKRKHIREQFKRFKELCPDLPSGKPHILEGSEYDPPDICIGDCKVGIEFRDFLQGEQPKGGSTQRNSEIFFDQIIREAQRQFEEQTKVPLLVFCHWLNYEVTTKMPKERIIALLVEVIARSIPIEEQQSAEIGWESFTNTSLENFIATISITKCPIPSQGSWTNVHRGRVGINAGFLAKLVQEKEVALPRYAPKFDSNWLIIVATGDKISSTAMPDLTVKPGCITSQFERVYFLDIWFNRLICLTGNKN